MEDIYEIANQIFSNDPKKRLSIQLDLSNEDISEVFEILCIFMAECLQIKLPRPGGASPPAVLNTESREITNNINEFILTLKLYFQSFGFNFQYDIINRDNTLLLKDYYLFQVDKKYNFINLATEFIYNNIYMSYIPGLHKSNNLGDYVLYLRIREIIYKIKFNFLQEY